MARKPTQFDPAKAETLSDWRLKNHDKEFKNEALGKWLEENKGDFSSVFGFEECDDEAELTTTGS